MSECKLAKIIPQGIGWFWLERPSEECCIPVKITMDPIYGQTLFINMPYGSMRSSINLQEAITSYGWEFYGPIPLPDV